MTALPLVLFLLAAPPPAWPHAENAERLDARVPPPLGYTRDAVDDESYAAFLRAVPLQRRGAPVLSYDGDELRAPALAVVDIDVGERDLQQCADSVIRLHAEYLLASKQEKAIKYKFTSGDEWAWSKRKQGFRPKVKGSKVKFIKRAKPSASRASFRAYLDEVFMWAGTASLARDAQKLAKLDDARAGDFFVHGGSPGHAVLILDAATDARGNRAVLLGQGFMPAQSFHVIQGPLEGWFPLVDGIATPSWGEPFGAETLRRLPTPRGR
jgi:hypothetical protein